MITATVVSPASLTALLSLFVVGQKPLRSLELLGSLQRVTTCAVAFPAYEVLVDVTLLAFLTDDAL